RGLSYTTFAYGNGALEAHAIAPGDSVKVTFTLANTGSRDGDDVAQIYFRHLNSKVPQPRQALCGFRRVSLKRGNSTKVTIEIPATRLRYWDADTKQYVVEPGDYEFLVGSASDDIRLKMRMTISAQQVSARL